MTSLNKEEEAMRLLAIAALYILSVAGVSAQELEVMHYSACPGDVLRDPSIEVLHYSVMSTGECEDRKIDAIVDKHLGIIYDMATGDLSIHQEIVDPQSVDVTMHMKACTFVTPRGTVLEWIVPNGMSCAGRPFHGYRLYNPTSVCIMPAVWCVPTEQLKSLGQQRARAAIDRAKRGRKVTQAQ
ncbi:MAG: hypothetical protein AAB605_02955 [Patescibacteria group bacterium]